jgi:hypothetical protein
MVSRPANLQMGVYNSGRNGALEVPKELPCLRGPDDRHQPFSKPSGILRNACALPRCHPPLVRRALAYDGHGTIRRPQ